MAKLVGDVRNNQVFDDVRSEGFDKIFALGCVCYAGRRDPRNAADILVEFCGRSPGDLVKRATEKVEVLGNFT
jgi:hypothetical protein